MPQPNHNGRNRKLQFESLETRRLLAGDFKLLKDINPTPTSEGSNPANIVAVGSVAFFTATTATTGEELWKSNGTEAGTVLVKDIAAGSRGSYPRYLTNVGGTLYFIDDSALWKSDGTEAGTVRVQDNEAVVIFPRNLTKVGGTLYFTAFGVTADDLIGEQLWKSDGTPTGTVHVKDFNAGLVGSGPRNLTNVGGTLYFSAFDGASGEELWKSDGTAAGTVRVKDISAGAGTSYPRYLTNVNGTLYFSAFDGAGGFELWKSDGTEAGTVRVQDNLAGASFNHRNLTNVGGTLYFTAFGVTADDRTTGDELWKSDGTAAGTVLVKDIFAGSYSSGPSELTNVGGTLYFTAIAVGGNELWKSDGTAVGTVLVQDFAPGIASSNPAGITPINDQLYIVATSDYGRELWVADISPPVAGDYNGDRVVDLTDYNVWRDTFGSTTNLAADGNGDGVIDAADYVIWRSNYQSPTGHVPIGASPPRRAPFVAPTSPVAIVAAASASTSAPIVSADSSTTRTDLLLTARDAAFAALGEAEPAAHKSLAKSPPRRAPRIIPAVLSDSEATFKP